MKQTNINKTYYVVTKLAKNLNRGVEIDNQRITTALGIVRDYFLAIHQSDIICRIDNIIELLPWKDYCLEKIMKNLNKIIKVLDSHKKKNKEMELNEVKARINYHRKVQIRQHKNKQCKDINKFDVVYVPTQGGTHYCVVYCLMANGTAICYPITTASKKELKILGNDSYRINDCGNDKFNGNILSSHSTVINVRDAGYFKVCHLNKHTEIERAIMHFNDHVT